MSWWWQWREGLGGDHNKHYPLASEYLRIIHTCNKAEVSLALLPGTQWLTSSIFRTSWWQKQKHNISLFYRFKMWQWFFSDYCWEPCIEWWSESIYCCTFFFGHDCRYFFFCLFGWVWLPSLQHTLPHLLLPYRKTMLLPGTEHNHHLNLFEQTTNVVSEISHTTIN